MENTRTKPLVSILMPCYNHAEYVQIALDSVIQDTYLNKEIVIINDGSTDQSHEKIAEWESKNQDKIAITYLNRENRGLCRTLNQMIELAKGEYLVILASDDMLINNTLDRRVQILLDNPSKKVLVCDAEVIDDDNKVIMKSAMTEYNRGVKEKYRTDDGILSEVLLNPSISGATVMMDRRIYDEIGLYDEDLLAEDWYFYQRAAAKKRIIFRDFICSAYRVHTTNTSGTNAFRSLKVARTIYLTYMRNVFIMPGVKYKFIAGYKAAEEALRYAYIYFLKAK